SELTTFPASLQIEKFLDRGHGARRVFFLRRMAEIVEDHKFATLNVAVKSLGIVRWNQAIAPAPQDERRHLDLRNAFIQPARTGLARALHEGGAIALARGEFVTAINLFHRDLGGIAVNIAPARLDQAARQSVSQNLVNYRHARQLESERNGNRLRR